MRPFFINCDDRHLFAMHVPPVTASNGQVFLFIPPFAEEMNKSRHMVMLQARRFAEYGFGTLIVDLTGCGDSSGEHGQASWNLWKQDIQIAQKWLRDNGYARVILWGHRIGALLAAECHCENQHEDSDLLLWQPVAKGNIFLTQFIRLKLAAELNSNKKESTKDIRQRLASGQTVEIAGYDLSADLALSIDSLQLIDFTPNAKTQTYVVEVSMLEEPKQSPSIEAVINTWEKKGLSVRSVAVSGEPFWATQEITVNNAVLQETESAIKMMVSNNNGAPQLLRTETDSGVFNTGKTEEIPYVFSCLSNELIGILHKPKTICSQRGVVIVVGGPQYRVGSHRQFVLLARRLADAGIPVLRFDYRGMGDSQGKCISFEESIPDVLAAVDSLCANIPTIKQVVLWGLCDAASAICLGAYKDPRISDVILLNPWVRTDSGEARTIVKHYYTKRLIQFSFWKKIITGKFKIHESFNSLVGIVQRSMGRNISEEANYSLPEKMALKLMKFEGRVFLILSGSDLTADEFREVINKNHLWKKIMNSNCLTIRNLKDSNHTFSKKIWREQVADWTEEFILSKKNISDIN